MPSTTPIFILDAIGPFFRHAPPGRINWSKIPFSYLELNGVVNRERFVEIRRDFKTVCEKAVEFGFNAISLDDLAHLTDHPDYPDELRARIRAYQEEYAVLFDIAAGFGLHIYITTDVMFYNETLKKELGHSHSRITRFFSESVDRLFQGFPHLSGIISRIGETDGLDVEGDFRSQLTIRNPRQARRFITSVLPVFEKNDRQWIFRTWSVGAYRIGDLIWNRVTLQETFDRIQSRHLTLSIKHGESDFFRYLPLNKQFFRGELPKMVELQARREYEGAGEYPSFIGFDYEKYRDQLREAKRMAGAMVWCQTGGWTRFRRLSFLDPDAVWNEINTWVAIQLFRDGVTAEKAIESWRQRYAPAMNGAELLRFLQLSDSVVRRLLYVEEFARQKIFFRRLRIPTQLSVFWDHILINHSMRQVLRCFVNDGEAAIEQARQSLRDLAEMKQLAVNLHLPVDDIIFMHYTFEVLAVAREYYFREFSPEIVARLTALRMEYRTRHPVRYSIHLDFKPVHIKSRRLRGYLKILFRNKRGYRLIDRIFTVRILSWLYPLLKRMGFRFLPEFSDKQAMGIDTLFK
jgi:hypothetical protein